MDTRKTIVFVLALVVVGLPVIPALGSNCSVGIWEINPGGFGYPIDAGQPYEPYDDDNPQGYDMIQLWMSDVAYGAEADDFYIMTSEGESMPIESIYVSQDIVNLYLYEPMPVQAWITVFHCGYPSKCIGYLPGDVDNNYTTDSDDLLAELNCVNPPHECYWLWQHDIDRDADIDMDDVYRLQDLLNGTGYDSWDGETVPDCDCESMYYGPAVEAVGSRYIAITPPEAVPFHMSFRVYCVETESFKYPGEPDESGLNIAILTSNPANAAFLTPDEWLNGSDAVYVTGADLAPDRTYVVEADYHIPWDPWTSSMVTTWIYGDVDNSGTVDFIDIYCTVECYQNNCGGPGCENVTVYSADIAGTPTYCLPDGVCDFTDISDVVRAFQDYPYACNDPCD